MSDEDAAEGRRFGNYVVHELLGTSGGARVYRAHQLSMDRIVTLTILPRALADRPALRTRFERQVAAASKLRHDNILSALDAGSVGGHQYIAAEYVGGRRLAALLAAGEWFGVRRALGIARDVARALEHVDSVGLLHRNVTPQTILLADSGVVKLRGFSFARPHRAEKNETWFEPDDAAAPYRAPDWITQRTLDVRADTYALGCVLYELLTGRPPFGGGRSAELMDRHVNEPVPDVRTRRADTPEPVARVLARMLEKDRDRRHPTPAALVAELTALAEGAASAPAAPAAPRPSLFRRRR